MRGLELPHGARAGLALAALLALVGALAVLDEPDALHAVDYERDVQPIFDAKCTACHPVSYRYLDLRRGRSYDQLVRVPAVTNPAFERVLPGRPELSYLLTHPPDPSNADLLSAQERALLGRWIAEGAQPAAREFRGSSGATTLGSSW